jgi:hypothetical protein
MLARNGTSEITEKNSRIVPVQDSHPIYKFCLHSYNVANRIIVQLLSMKIHIVRERHTCLPKEKGM